MISINILSANEICEFWGSRTRKSSGNPLQTAIKFSFRQDFTIVLIVTKRFQFFIMEQYYVQIITEKPVERFLQKLLLSNDAVQNLVIVSPWIGSLHQSYFCIENLCKKIMREEIPTYVITRVPEDRYHQEAVDIFLKTNFVEVRFNQSIHAKLYVCICQDMRNSFALFGSGNLTWASLNRNIEIGMMIFGYGPGRELIQELYYWGSVRLRTQKDSKLIKKIHR